jgi:hypothetical protein
MFAIGLLLAMFLTGLALAGMMVVLLPVRYFVDDRPFWADKPTLYRRIGLVAKNLLGLALVVLGILLSIPGIPGQGILTILIGLVLLDFPGKRKLVRLLARRRGVQSSLNCLRTWFGRPPLEFDESSGGIT